MRPNKRRQVWKEEEEQEVDDLAIAATFAQVTPTTTATDLAASVSAQPPKVPGDNNEIDIDSASSSASNHSQEKDSSDPSQPDFAADQDAKSVGTHDEEDDGSDLEQDLALQLAKMEETGDDEEAAAKNSIPPRTENELDPYCTPIGDLEKQFQLNLSVEDGQSISDNTEVKPAGNIRNHLVSDRTIVVESLVGSTPLDEGSLLVIRGKDELLPLGRIFEVFGPVTRPLYTIRLAPPKSFDSHKNSKQPSCQQKETRGDTQPVSQSSGGKSKESLLACKDSLGDRTSSTNGDCKDETQPTTVVPEESLRGDKESSPSSEQSQGIQMGNHQEQNQGDKNVTTGDKEVPLEDNGNSQAIINEDLVEGEAVKGTTEHQSEAQEDPWSSDGRFTRLLRESPKRTVYYIQNEAKLIDTNMIYRLSGRGCDASNIFDEEVNANEIDYSDDEEERQAQGRSRKTPRHPRGGNARRPRNNNDRNNQGQFHNLTPSGFYSPPMVNATSYPMMQQQQPLYPPQNTAAIRAAPQGFYHPNTGPMAGSVMHSHSQQPTAMTHPSHATKEQPEEDVDTIYYD